MLVGANGRFMAANPDRRGAARGPLPPDADAGKRSLTVRELNDWFWDEARVGNAPGAVLQQQEKLTVVQAAERPCFEDVRHPQKSTAPPKRRNAAKTIAAGACHMDAKGPKEELLRRCAVIDFDFASKQLPALRNPLTVLLYKPIGTLQTCAPLPISHSRISYGQRYAASAVLCIVGQKIEIEQRKAPWATTEEWTRPPIWRGCQSKPNDFLGWIFPRPLGYSKPTFPCHRSRARVNHFGVSRSQIEKSLAQRF